MIIMKLLINVAIVWDLKNKSKMKNYVILYNVIKMPKRKLEFKDDHVHTLPFFQMETLSNSDFMCKNGFAEAFDFFEELQSIFNGNFFLINSLKRNKYYNQFNLENIYSSTNKCSLLCYYIFSTSDLHYIIKIITFFNWTEQYKKTFDKIINSENPKELFSTYETNNKYSLLATLFKMHSNYDSNFQIILDFLNINDITFLPEDMNYVLSSVLFKCYQITETQQIIKKLHIDWNLYFFNNMELYRNTKINVLCLNVYKIIDQLGYPLPYPRVYMENVNIIQFLKDIDPFISFEEVDKNGYNLFDYMCMKCQTTKDNPRIFLRYFDNLFRYIVQIHKIPTCCELPFFQKYGDIFLIDPTKGINLNNLENDMIKFETDLIHSYFHINIKFIRFYFEYNIGFMNSIRSRFMEFASSYIHFYSLLCDINTNDINIRNLLGFIYVIFNNYTTSVYTMKQFSDHFILNSCIYNIFENIGTKMISNNNSDFDKILISRNPSPMLEQKQYLFKNKMVMVGNTMIPYIIPYMFNIPESKIEVWFDRFKNEKIQLDIIHAMHYLYFSVKTY